MGLGGAWRRGPRGKTARRSNQEGGIEVQGEVSLARERRRATRKRSMGEGRGFTCHAGAPGLCRLAEGGRRRLPQRRMKAGQGHRTNGGEVGQKQVVWRRGRWVVITNNIISISISCPVLLRRVCPGQTEELRKEGGRKRPPSHGHRPVGGEGGGSSR